MEQAVDAFYAKANRLRGEAEKNRLLKGLDRTFQRDSASHATLMNAAAPAPKRINAIRTVRNFPFHHHVDDYLQVVKDNSNPTEVRIAMAEALGWFDLSVQRKHIAAELKQLAQQDGLPEELQKEISQTLRRLE